ncbi:MAG: valine--tRNA ligase [Methanocellales archaeon]|nr:valine--tRNA ligase [Methanocellales archaeon]
MELPKEYDPTVIEPKWQERWEEAEQYRFDPDADGQVYVLDTPPPFTSGSLHIGHLLNHTWIDIAARYKRMRGYNVLLPQGFDCHGLPTELAVEEMVSKRDIVKFRSACVDWTSRCIDRMKEQFRKLGYSADWSREYRTMSPEYITKVQYSLLKFNELGLVYRKRHPVHYCWNCRTALAKAELGYKDEKGTLTYIRLKVDGSHLTIATTRPELMCACVAVMVHPNDRRYNKYVGKTARLPLYDRDVPIVADEDVDPKFGTGAVYVCTYGDEQDMAWQQKYSLPMIIAIDQNGLMKEAAGRYSGMSISECRKRIIADLNAMGAITRQDAIEHRVLVHSERSSCQKPVELIPIPQWFIRIKDRADDVIKAAKEMNWYPQYMFQRLVDWAELLDWDWVISRQRVFGTPIPFWYCGDCDNVIAPVVNDLPVNPATDKAPVDACPSCGSKNIKGSIDVCDCWVDSSITPLIASDWLGDGFDGLYPMSIRPQGYEIIRTWLFYTIYCCLVLTGKPPFRDVLVNGMVQGEDGKKMSKSMGNAIEPDEIIAEFGVDPIRQWAAGGTLGEDYPFELKEVVHSRRFLTKTWNIVRFCLSHDLDTTPYKPEPNVIDRWILSKLNRLIMEVTADLDGYEFKTIKKMRNFIWNELADNYIEMIKYRLYGDDPDAKAAAQHTLRSVVNTMLLMLAPFIPHFAEESYSHCSNSQGSIHLCKWPEADESLIDHEIEACGDSIRDATGAIRRYKAENGMPLNAELERVEIYAGDELIHGIDDIKGTACAKNIDIVKGAPEFEERIVDIEPKMGILGPLYRGKVSAIMEALKSDLPRAAEQAKAGAISIEVDGEAIELDAGSIEIKKEFISKGRAVDVLQVGDMVIAIAKPKRGRQAAMS